MKKKVIFWILTLFFATLIFAFSSQQALQSAQLSNSITEGILQKFPSFMTLPPEAKMNVLNLMNEVIRSLAHFSIFLFFGFSLASLLKCYPLKHPYMTAIVICVVYALTDEIHQGVFSEGRAFQFVDLLKDWLGSVLGIGIVGAFYKRKEHRLK